MREQTSLSSDTVEQFIKAVGTANVVVDEVARKLLSTDLSFHPGEIADVVVCPADSKELSTCVTIAASANMPVVARGGGMSYTQGYQPELPGSLLVDLRRMDQVIEINTEDMYVTVQSGCTWKKLYEALLEHDVRTPDFGPLSGSPD